jgi:hypothetical protein
MHSRRLDRSGWRAGMALCAMLLLAGCAGPRAASGPLYFVQLTDVHVGNSTNDARLVRAIEAINALPHPIACVVVTGDLFADNIEQCADDAARTYARLRAPVLFPPGNHDIRPDRLTETLAAYRRCFGPLATSAVFQGVEFAAPCIWSKTRPVWG